MKLILGRINFFSALECIYLFDLHFHHTLNTPVRILKV